MLRHDYRAGETRVGKCLELVYEGGKVPARVEDRSLAADLLRFLLHSLRDAHGRRPEEISD